jgi:hypothetical protein
MVKFVSYSRRLRKLAVLFVLYCVGGSSVHAKSMVVSESVIDSNVTLAPFYLALNKALKKRKTRLENICPTGDVTARRMLEEYGAMFLATRKVVPPPVCFFMSEESVLQFQEKAGISLETIGDVELELQPAAMEAYLKARDQALKEGLDITPRDGPEAARRTYNSSISLWNTRFLPALEYWLSQGRLTTAQVDRLKSMPLNQQVATVLELERDGVFFSKDFSKSILYSIAAPGASQHLAMLALDVNEFRNLRVRQLLAEHGWFQTVLSDLPHFTYLGLKEKDLPGNGLKRIDVNEQIFWIPDTDLSNPSANP